MPRKLLSRAGWALSGALAFVLAASLAESTFGGPLDPPLPVGSTYVTLDDLRHSWDRALSSSDGPGGDTCNSSRFKCVMPGSVSMLDRETGLVWTRSSSALSAMTWAQAAQACVNTTFGGRYGWRLPTAEELMTLYNLSGTNPEPSLPFDAPLTGVVDADGYWSSTADFVNPSTHALVVDFLGASAGLPGSRAFVVAKSTTGTYQPWCVRGGQAEFQ